MSVCLTAGRARGAPAGEGRMRGGFPAQDDGRQEGQRRTPLPCRLVMFSTLAVPQMPTRSVGGGIISLGPRRWVRVAGDSAGEAGEEGAG